MKINTQNSQTFGSIYHIRKMPIGEMVTAHGRCGAMYEYTTKKLSRTQNRFNSGMNQRIDNLVKTIQAKFDKPQVSVQTQANRELLLSEYVIHADDSMDAAIENLINNAHTNKLMRFFGISRNQNKINFVKFESFEKSMERFKH